MRYALVPSHFDAAVISSGTFTRENHYHINKADKDELVRHGLVEEIAATPGVEQSKRVLRLKHKKATRGFSCRFGEFLASRSPKDWLRRLIVSEMTHKPYNETQEEIALRYQAENARPPVRTTMERADAAI